MEEEAHEFFHTSDHFVVDDLFVDFNNGGDDYETNDVIADSNTATALANTSNSSSVAVNSQGDVQDGTSFSGELCVPSDELAELEWLSNFVEESFSPEDVDKLQLISGFKIRPDPKFISKNPENPNNTNPIFTADVSVPAKARSKRSRTAACNWASRGLLMETVYDNPFTGETILSTHHLSPPNSALFMSHLRKKQKETVSSDSVEERQCLHCATDKTPQWRTGPMGPKTLCNACGVRYKSGRLVPEYRPAASPTFVLTKHSNSHRKVIELRRQKEMSRAHHEFIRQHQGMEPPLILADDDYLIHHNVGSDFRQLI